ncbi:MAG TPA: ABC transporter permease [Longimicrobiales bacterium]
METLLNDIRYALRQFRRNPGVSAAAALTIALVVGANSAIFSVVNGVLLRPLPYPEQDELLRVYEVRRGRRIDVMSPASFLDLREQGRVLEVAAFERGEYVLVGMGDPVRLPGAQVSSGIFTEVLRVPPALGRGFRPDDNLCGSRRAS